MLSRRISPDPLDILWRFATGYMPDFVSRSSDLAVWVRYSHRGVQYLDQLQFPSGRKRYVYNPRFEFRINQAFAEVVRACSQTPRSLELGHAGQSWISPELIAGLRRLHARGYAHSYEAWSEGQLVGGGFGIQLGGYLTINSLFHHVSHASKFAFGRALFHLRDRGFRLVDLGMPPAHQLDCGAQWIPRWKFEEELPGLMEQRLSVADAWLCQPIPWGLRLGVPAVRICRALHRRWAGLETGSEQPAISGRGRPDSSMK